MRIVDLIMVSALLCGVSLFSSESTVDTFQTNSEKSDLIASSKKKKSHPKTKSNDHPHGKRFNEEWDKYAKQNYYDNFDTGKDDAGKDKWHPPSKYQWGYPIWRESGYLDGWESVKPLPPGK